MSRPDFAGQTIDLDDGLRKLSMLIQHEKESLKPHPYNLPKDVLRPDILWRRYVRKGILLTNGGTDTSLFSSREVTDKYQTVDYSQYRSDRPQSTAISSEEMKDFLCEEGLISAENKDQLFTEFSLGSHEAFTRIARCIYKQGENTGLLYPTGGYGLLIRSVALMKPTSYNVYLVDVDRRNGEKILPNELDRVAIEHPRAKTFYLESKNTCGAVYKEEELEELIFILDAAHSNMEFEAKSKFPDVTKICLKHGYTKFAVLTTGSKTYGLERGRVGVMVLGDEDLAIELNRNLFQTVGALGDWQIEVAKALVTTPFEKRREFLDKARSKHRYNRSVMIAYVEGIDSPNIDADLREQISAEIPSQYLGGIEGLNLVYKPEAGIQLKVSMDGLRDKYFGNIRMFNSEIFGYALSSVCGVSTLNSYQIMDPEGSGMRLSFSIKDDVHRGMQKIHQFVGALTNEVTPNPYWIEDRSPEDLIFSTQENKTKAVEDARSQSQTIDLEQQLKSYRNRIRNKLPKYVTKSASDDLLDKSVNEAAGEVQKLWRGHFASNEESTNRASATTLQKPSTRPKSAPTARRVIVEQGEQSQGGK